MLIVYKDDKGTYYCNTRVGGKPLKLVVDSGTSVSILSLETYKWLWNRYTGQTLLSNAQLKTFTGSNIYVTSKYKSEGCDVKLKESNMCCKRSFDRHGRTGLD